MSVIEQTKRQIDEIVGSSGAPFTIYHQGGVENEGFRWSIKPQAPSLEEINEINALQVKISQSILANGAVFGADFIQQLQEQFKAQSGHLSESARQFALQIFRFEGDHHTFSYVVEGEKVFNKVRDLASASGMRVYKTELFRHDSETSDYGQIILGTYPDQFDILRTEQTTGNNWYISTEGIINILKTIEGKFGLTITGADTSTLEFEIHRPLTPEGARWLNDELFQLSSERGNLTEHYDIKHPIVIGWD